MIQRSSICLPSQATVLELFSVARDAGIIPEIALDPVLTSFLSLDSSAALEHQYSSLQKSMTEEQLAAFRHNLTAELGGSVNRVPYGGVGVVALALSVLFDLVARQVRAQGSLVGEPSTSHSQAQMIFGIKQSSTIGWIIQDYLQEIPAIAHSPQNMAELTELYDNTLKLEMIDHFERMTNKKKRMSSESMQQWLVGAAFHLHMRIHQVRLQSVPSGSAESLRLSYKTGFTCLIQSYTAYLRKNIKVTPPPSTLGLRGRARPTANRAKLIDSNSLSNSGASKENMTRLGKPENTVGLKGGRNQTTTNQNTTGYKASGLNELSRPTKRGVNMSTVLSEEHGSFGLLVIDPQRNASHSVQHHPCESTAIEQALVPRIIEAQDLEHKREFFLYSEKIFQKMLKQKEDFKLEMRTS